MKKLIITTLLLCMTSTANAFALRFGSTLINEGKPATLLLMHMGEPMHKSVSDVCMRRSRSGDCQTWTTSEIWMYRHNELNYTIRVFNGVIQKIEWSRF